MAIRPEEITGVILKQLDDYEGKTEVGEEGFVLQVGDGIARVWGLANAMAGELLELPHGVFGMVLNLEKENVGCVLMGKDELIREGDPVRRTGRIMQVPVGDALIGRVVSPLGQPLVGKGPIKSTGFR
ncbi:MAG: F0F1 ATP synthase subunit alpha, partial [Elusimicrobiota bacterium]